MRISDWSSDVCSSDLIDRHPHVAAQGMVAEWRDQVVPGKDPLSNAPIVRIDFTVTAAEQCQASVMLLDLEGNVAVLLDVLIGLGKIGRASCRERVCQYV